MQHDYGYFEEGHLGQVGDLLLWRRLMAYTAPYWRGVVAAVFLALLITAASLALPYLVSVAVDRYIVNDGLETAARLQGVARLVLPFAGLMLLDFLANFLQVALLEWTGQSIMHRLRQQLFSHMLGLEFSFLNRHPVGKLVTRLTNDIQNMHEMFTSVIVTLFNDLIRVLGILAVLYWMNWRLALVMSLLIPIMAVNTIWFGKLARDIFREIRSQLARINGFLQETLAGMAVVQIFLRERDASRRFAEHNELYLLKTQHQIKIFAFFMPLIEVLSSCAIALIIWYGGGEIISGHMSLGVLVAFLSYMRLFFQPLRELSQKYSVVQSAMASAERIFQLLDTKTSRRGLDVGAAAPFAPGDGLIEFDRVTFGYESGRPVIENFSLVVQPGETLAIVGATGAGKSTVVNLLERFYEPEQGEIRLDGIDIRTIALQRLRESVGLVMQDIFIVPGTVRDNILLGRQMAESELQKVVDAAQLAKTIARLPDGWYTRIGEGGIGLSAGQKQLLAFARVLARDPRILVLDEATSSVDSETEMLVERAIAVTLANRTSIVIAHRLSTIRRADRILVMDHGVIAEQGSHAELLAARGLYYQLHTLQHSGKSIVGQ